MDSRVSISKAKSIIWLAVGLVMTMTWAVGATGWTENLSIIALVGLGSVLVSLLLVRSLLPALVAHLFSIIIGIAWSFWVTSRLLPNDYTWLERWQVLVYRLNQWYIHAIQGGTSYDNLMFILQMGLVVWGTGYLIIWFLLRSGKVWQAVMPGGLVLLINLYYAPRDITFWFLVYLMIGLLLAIRFNLFTQERQWRAEGIFFRPDIGFDFLRAGFVFSALIIGLAWILPPAVDSKSLGLFDEFQGSWHEFQQEWNRLYADLNYENVRAGDSFGKSLSLGGPRNLTNDPVMDVQVEGQGRYWRAAVYQEYTGLGWRSHDEESASFAPMETLPTAIFEARQPVTQTYTLYRDGVTMLYAMSHPISLDRSARVNFTTLSDEQIVEASVPGWSGKNEPWVEEITFIRSNSAFSAGESYRVVSAASQATVNQLRAAGVDYPAWITNQYLQLPDTVTQRTRDLAREITGSFDNPFDKARAVEAYLRTSLIYNEKMAAPPPNVDRVDYVLFNSEEAYCDYYASSMVVMLRSLGIPARFVAGFSRGAYDPNLSAFHVVSADAHSWVEVYFPRYGWIEFEPTAAQPGIARAVDLEAIEPTASGAIPENLLGEDQSLDRSNIPIDDENMASLSQFSFSIPWFGREVSLPVSIISWSLTALGAVVLLVLLGAAGLWWRQQRVKPLDDIFRLYRRMVWLADWMGIPFHPWQTPFEHAALLQRRIPSREREVEAITGEYVYQTFRPGLQHGIGTLDPVFRQEHITGDGGVLIYESHLAWRRLRPEMFKTAAKEYLLRLPRRLRRR